MSKEDSIHVLCNELIPIYGELDGDAKSIIEEHTKACSECRNLLAISTKVYKAGDEKNTMDSEENQIDVKPFLRLALFKKSFLLLLFLVRIMILIFVSLEFKVQFNYYSSPATLVSDIILLYFPFAALSSVITYFFYKKKIMWITLTLDVIVLLFFDDLLLFFM